MHNSPLVVATAAMLFALAPPAVAADSEALLQEVAQGMKANLELVEGLRYSVTREFSQSGDAILIREWNEKIEERFGEPPDALNAIRNFGNVHKASRWQVITTGDRYWTEQDWETTARWKDVWEERTWTQRSVFNPRYYAEWEINSDRATYASMRKEDEEIVQMHATRPPHPFDHFRIRGGGPPMHEHLLAPEEHPRLSWSARAFRDADDERLIELKLFSVDESGHTELRRTYLIDPARGYLIRKIEEQEGGVRVSATTEIEPMQAPINGVWLPRKITYAADWRIRGRKGGEARPVDRETVTTFSDFELNPEVDDEQFELAALKLAPGTEVTGAGAPGDIWDNGQLVDRELYERRQEARPSPFLR